jgi:ribosomal protein S18 acetylase RimI-like enzyme
MVIRKAETRDLAAVAALYEAVLDAGERAPTGWIPGVYPTERTARDALASGSLFVGEEAGRIAAAARIDKTQVPAYAACRWACDAPEDAVMVLHTLAVDPGLARRGWGRRFVEFYEAYALAHGCRELRMDTNAINTPARRLYGKLGYREVGTVPCDFNGIPGVELVCLEKTL